MRKLTNLLKSAILFAAMGLTFGLTSCTNDNLENPDNATTKLYIIYGGFAPSDSSRLALNTTTSQYAWQVGDGVCLYDAAGALVSYHAIESSEIQANGKVKLALRLATQPKYITIAGKNGSFTNDGAYVDINTSSIDLYSLTSDGVLSSSAPFLAQAVMSTSIVDGSNVISFNMQHKIAYVYIKSIRIDGNAINNVYVTTRGARAAVSNVLDQKSEISLSDVSFKEGTVPVGSVIAVIPGTTLTIAVDKNSLPLVSASLDAGFYTVQRDSNSGNVTLTFPSENTAMGTVSGSGTQSVTKGGAATPVTATPNAGYEFDGWYCNGVKLGASGTDPYGNTYTINGGVLTITNAQAAASYTAKFAASTSKACDYLNSSTLTNGSLNSMQVVVGETYTVKMQDASGTLHTYVITITGANTYSVVYNNDAAVTSMPNITLSGNYLTINSNGDLSPQCPSMQPLCTNVAYKDVMHAKCPTTCGISGSGIITSISAKNGNCTKTYNSDFSSVCTFLNASTYTNGALNMNVVINETYTVKLSNNHYYIITITGANSYTASYDGGAATTYVSGITVSGGRLSLVNIGGVVSGDLLADCAKYASLCTNTVYAELMREKCPVTCGYSNSNINSASIASISAKNGGCSKTYGTTIGSSCASLGTISTPVATCNGTNATITLSGKFISGETYTFPIRSAASDIVAIFTFHANGNSSTWTKVSETAASKINNVSYTYNSSTGYYYLTVSILGVTTTTSADLYARCTSLKSLCTNALYKDLMKEKCPVTCGYATTTITTNVICATTANRDVAGESWNADGTSDHCQASKYLCTNSIYMALMREKCPVTCGYTSGSVTVGDLATNCAVNVNLCHNAVYEQIMKEKCPATCGYITSGTISTIGDVLANCAQYKSLCTNQLYIDLMRAKCAGTCGYVTGSTTTITSTGIRISDISVTNCDL